MALCIRISCAIIAIIGVCEPDRRILVANLVVRNVDDDIVQALKARAGRRGTSAEAEHRRILAEALRRPPRRSFAAVLAAMPDVGKDADFERSISRTRDHVPR